MNQKREVETRTAQFEVCGAREMVVGISGMRVRRADGRRRMMNVKHNLNDEGGQERCGLRSWCYGRIYRSEALECRAAAGREIDRYRRCLGDKI